MLKCNIFLSSFPQAKLQEILFWVVEKNLRIVSDLTIDFIKLNCEKLSK